jgi:hypothetical protein
LTRNMRSHGGLSRGDVVVSEGGYLIDSESQIRAGDGAAHEHNAPAVEKVGTEERPKEHKH